MADEDELVDENMPDTPEDEEEALPEGEEPAEEEAEEEPAEDDGLTWKQRYENAQRKLGQQSNELGDLRKFREEVLARNVPPQPETRQAQPAGETYDIGGKARTMDDILDARPDAEAVYRRLYKPLVDNGLMDEQQANLLSYEEAFDRRDRDASIRREYEPLRATAAQSRVSVLAQEILTEVPEVPQEELQAFLQGIPPEYAATMTPDQMRSTLQIAMEAMAYRRMKAAKPAPTVPAAKAPRTASAASGATVNGDLQARIALIKREAPSLTDAQAMRIAKEGGW